jgi:hypothetical protein
MMLQELLDILARKGDPNPIFDEDVTCVDEGGEPTYLIVKEGNHTIYRVHPDLMKELEE